MKRILASEVARRIAAGEKVRVLRFGEELVLTKVRETANMLRFETHDGQTVLCRSSDLLAVPEPDYIVQWQYGYITIPAGTIEVPGEDGTTTTTQVTIKVPARRRIAQVQRLDGTWEDEVGEWESTISSPEIERLKAEALAKAGWGPEKQAGK